MEIPVGGEKGECTTRQLSWGILEGIDDLLENPNYYYGELTHDWSARNGIESHHTWKDVTWTVHGFGGRMFNFLAQVGFMNEWGNRWITCGQF
jgi:hypothetical protein